MRRVWPRLAPCATRVSKRREGFFFEKKKQKTFVNLGRAGFSATVLKEQKPLFSKKRLLSSFAL
jgi:hypothetical protein